MTGQPREVPAASPGAIAIARSMLYEITMFDLTNQFIDGRAWGDQPHWRIRLFLAYHAGRGSAE